MALCYYISAHGLGHAIRSAQIINEIDPKIPVIIRSTVLPKLLAEEIRRPFSLQPEVFDCGAVQKDGFTVDGPATLARFADIHRTNQTRLRDECEFLRNSGVRLVVSDIASFPLRVAHEIGIPSVAVGNFTWAGIYRPLVASAPDYQWMLKELEREYLLATRGIRLPLSVPMDELRPVVDVPLVHRQGVRIRPALAGYLDIDPDATWVLLYLGQYPTEFDWSRLAGHPSIAFLAYDRDAAGHPEVRGVDTTRFSGPDLLASCDVVVGKPGYGTVADCIAANIPMVYALPSGFAESNVLDEELSRWGRAVRIDRRTLMSGDFFSAIDEALRSEAKHSFPIDGAAVVARRLEEMISV